MAGADSLREKILEDARLQAAEVLERARKEAAGLLESARKKAGERTEELLEKAGKEADEKRRRMISVAELEGRKTVLQAKQEMVEEAFLKAVEKLNSLPAAQYEAILSEMAAGSITGGNAEIILSTKDRERLSKDFIANINALLKSKGIAGSAELSEETRDLSGGFVLKTGNVEINYSFEAMIKMQRDELEAEIVKVLFRS